MAAVLDFSTHTEEEELLLEHLVREKRKAERDEVRLFYVHVCTPRYLRTLFMFTKPNNNNS